MPYRPTNPEVRFMSPQEFEDEAALLLAEYGNAHRPVTSPPVPIDDIIEEHFKLAIEFQDMLASFPEGDVQGAIWFNEKRIAIDTRLVPEENPAMRGRYRFTLAHELAHWRLHRHLYLQRAGQPPLFPDGDARPDHVLRSNSSDPKEVQANRLAACILMPREMVKRAWHGAHGSMEPVSLRDLRARRQQVLAAEVLRRGGVKQGEDGIDNMLLEHVARPLADTFEVSPDAMRIRLEGLSLLVRSQEPPLIT